VAELSVHAFTVHDMIARGAAVYGDAPAVKLAMAWRATDESPVLASFLEKARAAAPAEGERGRRGPARN